MRFNEQESQLKHKVKSRKNHSYAKQLCRCVHHHQWQTTRISDGKRQARERHRFQYDRSLGPGNNAFISLPSSIGQHSGWVILIRAVSYISDVFSFRPSQLFDYGDLLVQTEEIPISFIYRYSRSCRWRHGVSIRRRTSDSLAGSVQASVAQGENIRGDDFI